jgi:hypothetical protein
VRIRFTAYRAADRGWGFRRNRYYVGTCCEQTIGAGFLAGRRAFGVTWCSPRAPSVAHDRLMHPQ